MSSNVITVFLTIMTPTYSPTTIPHYAYATTRCECCANAYCEDCLPFESIVQGESDRLSQLGYRMSGNSCYILCSIECIEFYNTELKTTTEVVQPHQQVRSGEYEHDYSKNNTRKSNTSGTTSGGNDIGNIEGKDEQESGSDSGGVSSSSNVPIFTSIEHALNNCALDDIKDRLGYPKPAASTSISNTATHTTSTNNNADTTTTNTTSNEHALHRSVQVRFKSLSEIPNFAIRLHKSSQRVKSLLFKLTNDIMVYQDKLKKKLKAETEGGAAGKCVMYNSMQYVACNM